MTEYDVCNICNQLVLSRNKRKGEHMIVKHPYITVCNNCIEKCKNICPICFSKIAFDEVLGITSFYTMANECPVCQELKTTLQLRKLRKRKYPQPFYFICNECYMTLKSKTNLIFDKFLCQICHQDVQVLNFEQINKCLTYKGNKKKE